MNDPVVNVNACGSTTEKANRVDMLKQWTLTPWTIVLLVPLLVLLFDAQNLWTVIDFAVRALISSLPYIVFAVLLIAWLKAIGAETSIARAFKGHEVRMIFLAALFGGLAPFCSCEVIPFITGLLMLGAPLSAIMAFWLSSPLIDPPTLLITASALGWPFALGKAVAAIFIGLMGGFFIKAMKATSTPALKFYHNPLRDDLKQACGSCGTDITEGDIKWRFWQESDRVSLFKTETVNNGFFLLKWLSLAYMLEAILVDYVPADYIVNFVGGDGIQPIVLGALIGMPAYLNSYAAPPLLAGLIEQGMSNGAAMAFMITGSVSCIPAMAAVWSLVRPQVFFTYIGLGLVGGIFSGFVFQLVVG